MEEVERLLAEQACRRVILEYARRVDSGRASAVAELFTLDGVWEGADGRVMRGRDEIRDAFLRREKLVRRTSRHVCTNVLVDVETEHRAVAVSYLINYRHDARDGVPPEPAPAQLPKFMGEYHDRLVRTRDDGWLIAHRRFDLVFLRQRRDVPSPD
ncbi:MAG TPA: nuclear transport factor 2 family protein [Amycolatopsis sp.]|nr:nuclear transport factor 2 family protein [Amycolatopsis sp.]